MLFRCGRLQGISAERSKISQLVCPRLSRNLILRSPPPGHFYQKAIKGKHSIRNSETQNIPWTWDGTWGPWPTKASWTEWKRSGQKERKIAIGKSSQIDSIQCLNFASNWFNSIFNSIFNSKLLMKIWLILGWSASMASSSPVSPLGWTAVLSHRPLLPRPE